MTLEHLGEEENRLLSYIDKTIGSLEERDKQLEEQGVFEAYQQIHSQYADLAPDDSEALKCSLFLQWYAMLEPSFLSGINELDPQAEKRVINTLIDKITQNNLDSELYSMVSYYAGWEYVLDHFDESENLKRMLESRLDFDEIIHRLKQSNLTDRGQMGIYWQSIVSSR